MYSFHNLDLYRRPIEVKEREFLKENKIVSEVQCDLGMTMIFDKCIQSKIEI